MSLNFKVQKKEKEFVFSILLNNWSISHRQWVIWKIQFVTGEYTQAWNTIRAKNTKSVCSLHPHFFVLNLDFSKLGWNSKSLLIYTDLTKHAQLKITHKKTTFSHLRSTNAVLSLSMQSLTWYRLYIIIYITWSRNHSIWSHDENMKYFFTWYMTAIVCMKPNVWTIIKNASLPQWFARLDVLLTRIPTMWRKHVKKIQTNPWSLAVLQILLYIIHIKIFKPSHAHVLK